MLKKGLQKTTKFLKNTNFVKTSTTQVQKKNYAEPPKDWNPETDMPERNVTLDVASILINSTVEKFKKKEHANTIYVVGEEGMEHPSKIIDADEKFDAETYKYTTKYPDETYEEWYKKYEEAYLDDEPVTEEFIDDVTELSGMERKDVAELCSKRYPEFAIYDHEGKFKNINWNNVKNEFKLTPKVNGIIDEIEHMTNMIQYRIDHHDETLKSLKRFDWQSKEREIGEEKALAQRERTRGLLIDSFRTQDRDALLKNVDRVLDPVIAKGKDDIIDQFPMFQNVCQRSKSLSRQLKLDEDGIPVWDYSTIQFVDTFYPEVRDEILVEIDNFDYDMEYTEQFKQLSHSTTDELFEVLSENNWKKIVERHTKEFFRNYQDTTQSKREQLVNNLKQQLDDTIDENEELVRTISKLKSQMEYVESSPKEEKKAESESKKDKINVDLTTDPDLLSEISFDPSGKRTIVKDWKHKPEEVIEVVMEEKDEEKL